MSKKLLIIGVLAVLVAGIVSSGSAQAAPYGTLTAQCVGNAVYLEWGSRSDANSNGLQKGDSYPNDPDNYWGWLTTTGDQRSYTDYSVTPGIAYQYRVKYRPDLPSNVVTITCPAPTPVPSVNNKLQVSAYMTARNATLGQTGEYASVQARPGDTINFFIHVRAPQGSWLTNVMVNDYLPFALTYIGGSTVVDGYSFGDSLTSQGINIGGLSSEQETVIRFSARVNELQLSGQTVVNNNAIVHGDNTNTVSAQLPITLGNSPVVAVAKVKTGPTDSILLALFMAILATGAYAMYTQTETFNRRLILAEISRLARNNGTNFSH
jgi:uncharacterized repeat protein (TIGR01451 family)